MPIDPLAAGLAILGIVIGGVLKGATGAGAPIVAVPMLVMVFDVPTAVTIFAVPNLLSNAGQAWVYRGDALPRAFTVSFSAAGLAGAAVGTVMLTELPPRLLIFAVALVVFAYIAFRLRRPDWHLGFEAARRLTLPFGFAGGILQGAVGVSAPVSVTFLSAMRLERRAFISTISVFFTAMSAAQVPMLVGYGLMTLERALLGLGALALLTACMPLGAALARRVSRETFDRVILALLAVIAVRLVVSVAG